MHESCIYIMIRLALKDAISEVRSRISSILRLAPPIISEFTSLLSQSEGKLFRATALLVCAQDTDGFVCTDAVTMAVAVEILHLATLVHDDVIDDAEVRRGNPTINSKHGRKTAVICGDYLFCVCIGLATEVSKPDEDMDLSITKTMERICMGELLQHLNNGNFNLSIPAYLRIIRGKTAALFEGAFYVGAYYSKDDKQKLNKFKLLGRFLGQIFQITDDCIDYESSLSVAGKGVNSDLEQGVITLPLIHTMSQDSDFKQKILNKFLGIKDIYSFVIKSGGVSYAKGVSERYYKKALRLIDEINPTPKKRQELLMLFEKAGQVTKDKGAVYNG